MSVYFSFWVLGSGRKGTDCGVFVIKKWVENLVNVLLKMFSKCTPFFCFAFGVLPLGIKFCEVYISMSGYDNGILEEVSL